MAVNKNVVVAKARGMIEALSKVPAKQLEQRPSVPFAQEFNRLLELAKEFNPDLDPRAWPHPIEIHEGGYGQKFIKENYVEIEVYARQILSLLRAKAAGEAGPRQCRRHLLSY